MQYKNMYCVGGTTLIVNCEHNVAAINMINMVPNINKVILKNLRNYLDPQLLSNKTVYIYKCGDSAIINAYLPHYRVAMIGINTNIALILRYYRESKSFYLDLTPYRALNLRNRHIALQYIHKQFPVVISIPHDLVLDESIIMYVMFNTTIREIRVPNGTNNAHYIIEHSHSVLVTNINGVDQTLKRNMHKYKTRIRYIYMILRVRHVPKYVAIMIINGSLAYYKLCAQNNTVVYKQVFH